MPSIRWSVFADEFLSLYGPPFGPMSTKRKYVQILREFGRLGAKTTLDLSPAMTAKWVVEHQDRAAAGNQTLLRHLMTATNYAIRRGYLKAARSPFAGRPVHKWVDVVELEDEMEEKVRHQSIEDIGKVLKHLSAEARDWKGRRLEAIANLVAYTGVRKNEALYAEISDFNLERRVFRVKPNKGNPLKTKKSSRIVPIPDRPLPILEAWIKSLDPTCKWVFPGVTQVGPWTGGPPGGKALHRLVMAGEAVGVPGFGFLSLRHSFATHAEIMGVSDSMRSRLMGHTSQKTTKAWYAHPDLPNMRAAVSQFDFGGR